MDFVSKVYIVTGGAAGMGLAITKAMLDHGAIVYTCDIHEKMSSGLAALPQQQQLVYARCDVRKRSECHSFVRAIVDKHERIDGLVNNAGICPLEGELPGDDLYDAAFDVNVRGVWNFGTEVLTQMKEMGGGSMVNIGSISSLQGVRRLPLYVATKHAVLGLTRTWALDFAQYKIRVNCVAPGAIDTDMARSPLQTVMGPRFGGNKSDDELLELVGKSLPLGRMGQPGEVAHQVLFLLSDLASFTTGQIICVSGGQ